MQSPNYEFDDSQNVLIQNLASRMKFVGYFLVVSGIVSAIIGWAGDSQEAGVIITGITDVLIGIWTTKAASSFKLIVDTQGEDITNLMTGLGELRNLYTLQYWVLVITLALLIVVGGVLFMIGVING